MGLFGPNIKKLGRAGDISGLVEVLTQRRQQDWWEETSETLVKMGDQPVGPLVEVLYAFPGDKSKCEGPSCALSLFGEPAVEPLVKVISDGPKESGVFAAVALQRLGEVGVGRTIGLIRRLEDSERRTAALIALHSGGGPSTWDALRELVRVSREDEDQEVRNLAASYVQEYDLRIRDLEADLRQRKIALNVARCLYCVTAALGGDAGSALDMALAARQEHARGLVFESMIDASEELKSTWTEIDSYYLLIGLGWDEREERCPEWDEVREEYADFFAAQDREDYAAAVDSWLNKRAERL